MSVLTMFACESCGATATPDNPTLPRPPFDWLLLEGPVTNADLNETEYEFQLRDIRRHVCSPVCLLALAQRLNENEDVIGPVSTVSNDE